jgi:1,4-alpha-glucan branching enzyme
LYATHPQLYGSDADHDGFRWIDLHNADESVWAFQRLCTGGDTGPPLTCVFNATPVPRNGYRIGVPRLGEYRKLLDSDATRYGGSGYNGQMSIEAAAPGSQGYEFALQLDLPPLGALFLEGPAE